jgi:hypothetical protein
MGVIDAEYTLLAQRGAEVLHCTLSISLTPQQSCDLKDDIRLP